MVESQQKATKPELYERLIDRLGMALDAAKPLAGYAMNALWSWNCAA